MARYVFITGGVVSSLGKGIAAASLGGLLQVRGHLRVPGWLASPLVRQLLAGAAMGAALWFVQGALADRFAGSAGDRILATGALVASGTAVYFAVAWVIGAMNRDDILILLRKKKVG